MKSKIQENCKEILKLAKAKSDTICELTKEIQSFNEAAFSARSIGGGGDIEQRFLNLINDVYLELHQLIADVVELLNENFSQLNKGQGG